MGRSVIRMLLDFQDTLVIALVPVLASALLFMDELDEVKFKCLYVVVIMSLYWVFEVLPLAITALIPLVLFPSLGIMKSDAVAKTYLPDTGFLFIGGLMVAVAVEKANLHTRIALLVLSLVGSDPRFIMAGFMAVTAFLSMWISNTATAALMVPIVQSVISELVSNQRSGALIERQHLATRRRSIEGRRLSMTRDPLTAIDKETARIEAGPSSQTLLPESESRRALVEHEEKMAALCSPSIVRLERAVEEAENHLIPFPAQGDNLHLMTRDYDTENITLKDMVKHFNPQELQMAKGFLISVCYAANIGGAATITGTASNLVLIGQLEKIFPGSETGINFLSWICFAVPMTLLSLFVCWIILCFLFLSDAPKGSHSVSMRLKEKYNRLPPISFAEYAVAFCFLLLLVLWVFRDPKFIAGLGAYFKKGYVTDATSAVFIVIILFVLPEKCPDFSGKKKKAGHKGLLDWQVVQESFPWSVVLLLGGGFALAAGVKESELSQMIGDLLSSLGGLDKFTAVTICVIITIGLTNVCSNTVVASIFTPIVAELARSLSINPLLFMLPVTIASSFAFLLPVATPPNAIVFGAGVVGVKDMAKAGFLVSICCAFINVFNMYFYANWLFALDTFPEWANYNEILAGNATSFLLNVLTDNQTVAILTQN